MATYIISPTGNDANPGTLASPKALSWLNSLTAGDIAELRGGTYVDSIEITGLSGTSGSHITIRAYDNEEPILDGEWDTAQHPLTTPGTLDLYEFQPLFGIDSSTYVDISDIRVINSDGRGFQVTECDNVVFDNVSGQDIYGMVFHCTGGGPTGSPTNTNITLKNSDFYNVCVAWKWFQTTVEGEYINNIPSSVFFARGTSDCLIENCTLERTGAEGFVAGRGNRRVTFRNCYAVDCRHTCYYLEMAQYSTIERCVAYFTAAGDAAITGIRGQGIILRDETGAYNQGYGTNYESTNCTVENCIVIGAELGYSGYGQASMKYFTLRNNTFVNSIQNIKNRSAIGSRPTPVGNVFENNIFYNGELYSANIFFDQASALGNQVNTTSGATYNNNLWYDINGGSQPANGAGTGDVVNEDPVMQNPNISLNGVTAIQFRDLEYAQYYQINSGSPAINASSDTVSTDFLARAAVGVRDIGAMEYDATDVTPPPTPPPPPSGSTYATPKRWVHGDQPNATEMNKYSDSLNAIHDIAGDVEYFFGAAHLRSGEDNNHYFRHTHRWLWFSGDGTLEDADAANETITLTDSNEPTRYDLNTVSWLAPGKLYYISDCIWGMETPEP